MTETRTYSLTDRLLHKLAFSSRGAQIVLADMMSDMLAETLPQDLGPPVFITSLPRAGTTLLLEILSASPDLASHTYRDMPFVLCPMVWNRLSGGWRKSGELRERAHGDGMQVGYDSPEAFEEILWMAFWKSKYGDDHVETWTDHDRDEEFEDFFADHMRKICALRSNDVTPRRYVSKNNANIARLSLLRALHPSAKIVVPVRRPADQIASLRRQHARFKSMHAKDAFSLQYMSGIGHFEFGAALKPIDFGGWTSAGEPLDPDGPDFWLKYWIAAYSAILSCEHAILFDYEAACAAPLETVGKLCADVEIAFIDDVRASASRLQPPAARHDLPGGGDPQLIDEVEKLHQALLGRMR